MIIPVRNTYHHRALWRPTEMVYSKLVIVYIISKDMERGASLRSKSLLVALLLAAVPNALGQNAKQKREAAYQAALQSYSEVLKPGMSRKEVKDYLNAKCVTHITMCCLEERSPDTDLVKIGKEKHPWYCSEHNVYIAFLFAEDRTERLQTFHRDSDKLKVITIYHWLQGCL